MKKLLSKTLLTTALTLGLGVSSAFASGVPTADAAALAQRMQNQMETIMHMKAQLQTQVESMMTLAKQLELMTKKSTWEKIVKDSVDKSIPQEWKDLYNTAGAFKNDMSNGIDFSSASAANVNQIQDMISSSIADNIKDSEVLDDLTAKLNETTSPKEAEDLQNTISVLMAKMKLKQDQLNNWIQAQAVQEKQLQKREREYDFCRRHAYVNGGDPDTECSK